MTNRKFTLEYIDQATACIIAESVFEVDDVTALCEILDVSEADLRPSISYSLDMEDIEKIKFRFNITKESPSTGAYLSSWSDLTQLPYTIHTRRELIMMLRGEKPFAAFMDSFPSFAEFEIIPESRFAPYVESGLFIKKEYLVDEGTERQARRVLYAARGEEWRIEAAMQLWKTAETTGWSEEFERREGMLYGYEDWQTDAWIAFQLGRSHPRPFPWIEKLRAKLKAQNT